MSKIRNFFEKKSKSPPHHAIHTQFFFFHRWHIQDLRDQYGSPSDRSVHEMMKSLLLDTTETASPSLPLYPEGLSCINQTEADISLNANGKGSRIRNDNFVARDLPYERGIVTEINESGSIEDKSLPPDSVLANSQDRRLVGTFRHVIDSNTPAAVALNNLTDCSSDNKPFDCMKIDALTAMTKKYEEDEEHFGQRSYQYEASNKESFNGYTDVALSEDIGSNDDTSQSSESVGSSSTSSSSSSSSSSCCTESHCSSEGDE